MRLIRRLFYMRGRSVLLRNNCLPVIYALEKWSSSPQSQAAAEAVCRAALEAGVKKVLYMHIRGEQLIVDVASTGARGRGQSSWQARRVHARPGDK